MQLEATHWLYALKAEIQKIEPTAQLILYGSRARGDARPDSDWDLLLLAEKATIPIELEDALRTPVYLAELAQEEAFSLQIFTKSDWQNRFNFSPYYKNVQREGIWV
jgi:uncharacterized protein